MTSTVFFFDTPEPVIIQEVGGKALGLIDMTRQGLPVPSGFVLPVSFCESWLAAVTASPAWQAAQVRAGDALSQATRELQALCRDLSYDAQQQQTLDQALAILQNSSSDQLFAVRSSSPEEDLGSASFAGGYETTLGVPAANLWEAIRRTFASCFSERVILYKREHNLPTDQARIAIIVQQQVDADRAGVAFSVNPLNNCYDEALINATHGLGESVVSGSIDPDVFVVNRLSQEILATKVGGNGMITRLNPAGGTSQAEQETREEACLVPGQVRRIAGLLDRVEAYYQHPLDIEWAFAGNQLYLLQVRPITTYLPLPQEMVTPPGAPKRLYANSTLIEQGLQEPLSVLGTDFLGYVLEQVGGPVAKGGIGIDGITFTAAGGYYMNISYAMMLGMNRAALAPGSFGDPRVMAILDNMDIKPYLSGELPKKLKSLRGKMIFNMLPMVKSILRAYLRPEDVLRKYLAALPGEVARFDSLPDEGLSLKDQAIRLSELLQFFYGDYGIPMILAAQITLLRIKRLFKNEAAQAQDHLVNLGVALPGNKTTEMGERMYALAEQEEVNRYDSAVDFLAALEENRLSADLIQAWQDFMVEFSFRCPGEIDPATPRPKEQPGRFFEQLKSMSLTIHSRQGLPSFFEEARAKREAAYQALYKIALKKGQKQARALERYYRTWVMLGGYRETPKHYVIKVVDLFRQRALRIGQALAAGGRLDRPEQIFDLTIADIDRALEDDASDLRALAQDRSQLIHKMRQCRLAARVIDSRGKIFFPPRLAVSNDGLAGVPISPGLAQGRVKVFHHAMEKQLLPGEILVARVTDPGWTPLFINAGGIILEIGGALQHGAVVAREYGIPCVSGVDGATELLHDGQLVEVDGSNGTVRILVGRKEPRNP